MSNSIFADPEPMRTFKQPENSSQPSNHQDSGKETNNNEEKETNNNEEKETNNNEEKETNNNEEKETNNNNIDEVTITKTEKAMSCPTCQTTVLESNLELHTLHCERHFTKCNECSMMIRRDQAERHKQGHKLQLCPLGCLTSVQSHLMGAHQELDCENAEIECQFCELVVVRRVYSEHWDYCGSKTDLCAVCARRVMLKDFTRHLESNCTFPPPKQKPVAPQQSHFQHQLQQVSAQAWLHEASPLTVLRKDFRTNQFHCRECYKPFPNAESLQIHILSECEESHLSMRFDHMQEEDDLEDFAEMLPCEFCDEFFAPSKLQGHQRSCTPLSASALRFTSPMTSSGPRRRPAAVYSDPMGRKTRKSSNAGLQQGETPLADDFADHTSSLRGQGFASRVPTARERQERKRQLKAQTVEIYQQHLKKSQETTPILNNSGANSNNLNTTPNNASHSISFGGKSSKRRTLILEDEDLQSIGEKLTSPESKLTSLNSSTFTPKTKHKQFKSQSKHDKKREKKEQLMRERQQKKQEQINKRNQEKAHKLEESKEKRLQKRLQNSQHSPLNKPLDISTNQSDNNDQNEEVNELQILNNQNNNQIDNNNQNNNQIDNNNQNNNQIDNNNQNNELQIINNQNNNQIDNNNQNNELQILNNQNNNQIHNNKQNEEVNELQILNNQNNNQIDNNNQNNDNENNQALEQPECKIHSQQKLQQNQTNETITIEESEMRHGKGRHANVGAQTFPKKGSANAAKKVNPRPEDFPEKMIRTNPKSFSPLLGGTQQARGVSPNRAGKATKQRVPPQTKKGKKKKPSLSLNNKFLDQN